MSDQLEDVRHDYIRYANCWEDADILIKALKPEPGDKILSIGSAGDNSFSLLLFDPEYVVAVDINLVQLRLIELKKAAFQSLTYDEFVQFLGFTECPDRSAIYEKVREAMNESSRIFWDERKNLINDGIIHAGKFEKYFRLFHTRILPFIHTKKRIKQLFAEKSEAEQQAFFNNSWNNLRWRLLFRIFFSRFIMGRFGRDPKFLNEVKVSVPDFILDKSRTHLSSTYCQQNYFLRYILTGTFGSMLPHYAREEHFEAIKNNLERLHTFHGLAEDAFAVYPEFNKFNLSNIFEYMDNPLFKTVSENIVQHGAKGSRFAYWNLMVPRKIHDVNEDVCACEDVHDLGKTDLGFFYGSINCDQRV